MTIINGKILVRADWSGLGDAMVPRAEFAAACDNFLRSRGLLQRGHGAVFRALANQNFRRVKRSGPESRGQPKGSK